MSKIYTPNIFITTEYKYIQKYFINNQSSRLSLNDLPNNSRALLISNKNNKYLQSVEYSLNYKSTNATKLVLKFVDIDGRFEESFLDNSVIKNYLVHLLSDYIKNKKFFSSNAATAILRNLGSTFKIYIAFGVGNDLANWAGPITCELFSANIDINSNNLRVFTYSFFPTSAWLFQSEPAQDAEHPDQVGPFGFGGATVRSYGSFQLPNIQSLKNYNYNIRKVFEDYICKLINEPLSDTKLIDLNYGPQNQPQSNPEPKPDPKPTPVQTATNVATDNNNTKEKKELEDEIQKVTNELNESINGGMDANDKLNKINQDRATYETSINKYLGLDANGNSLPGIANNPTIQQQRSDARKDITEKANQVVKPTIFLGDAVDEDKLTRIAGDDTLLKDAIRSKARALSYSDRDTFESNGFPVRGIDNVAGYWANISSKYDQNNKRLQDKLQELNNKLDELNKQTKRPNPPEPIPEQTVQPLEEDDGKNLTMQIFDKNNLIFILPTLTKNKVEENLQNLYRIRTEFASVRRAGAAAGGFGLGSGGLGSDADILIEDEGLLPKNNKYKFTYNDLVTFYKSFGINIIIDTNKNLIDFEVPGVVKTNYLAQDWRLLEERKSARDDGSIGLILEEITNENPEESKNKKNLPDFWNPIRNIGNGFKTVFDGGLNGQIVCFQESDLKLLKVWKKYNLIGDDTRPCTIVGYQQAIGDLLYCNELDAVQVVQSVEKFISKYSDFINGDSDLQILNTIEYKKDLLKALYDQRSNSNFEEKIIVDELSLDQDKRELLQLATKTYELTDIPVFTHNLKNSNILSLSIDMTNVYFNSVTHAIMEDRKKFIGSEINNKLNDILNTLDENLYKEIKKRFDDYISDMIEELIGNEFVDSPNDESITDYIQRKLNEKLDKDTLGAIKDNINIDKLSSNVAKLIGIAIPPSHVANISQEKNLKLYKDFITKDNESYLTYLHLAYIKIFDRIKSKSPELINIKPESYFTLADLLIRANKFKEGQKPAVEVTSRLFGPSKNSLIGEIFDYQYKFGTSLHIKTLPFFHLSNWRAMNRPAIVFSKKIKLVNHFNNSPKDEDIDFFSGPHRIQGFKHVVTSKEMYSEFYLMKNILDTNDAKVLSPNKQN